MQRNDGINEDGTLTDQKWLEIVESINKDASPGVDYCYQYKRNKDLLDSDPNGFRQRVESRMAKRLELFKNPIQVDGVEEAIQRIEMDLVSPVRVFNKDEPTKWTKETRLVNSLSAEDNAIEKATSLKKANKFMDHWMDSVSTVGIKLKNVECMAEFRAVSEEFFGVPEGASVENTDVRGWEWAFKKVAHRIALDIEFYLETGGFPEDLPVTEWSPTLRLLWVEHHLSVASKVLVLSDGRALWTDHVWMLSGKFKTSFQGTHVRSALCSIVATMRANRPVVVAAKSNGDDCLNKTFKNLDYTSEYLEAGFVITDRFVAARPADAWSFCSHRILRDNHYVESITKLVLSLFRHKELTCELWDDFSYNVRTRPDFESILSLVREVLGREE